MAHEIRVGQVYLDPTGDVVGKMVIEHVGKQYATVFDPHDGTTRTRLVPLRRFHTDPTRTDGWLLVKDVPHAR